MTLLRHGPLRRASGTRRGFLRAAARCVLTQLLKGVVALCVCVTSTRGSGGLWENGGMPEGRALEGSKGAPGGLHAPPLLARAMPSEVC